MSNNSILDKARFDTLLKHVIDSPRYDITNYIEENITKEIDKSGRNPKLKCPFHGSDSSPSFSVVKDDKFFKCFGCDKAGSVVSLMMYWEEIKTGTLPKISVFLERLLNTDPLLRLEVGFVSVFKDDAASYEEIINTPVKRFKPREKRNCESFIELKHWMEREGKTSYEDIVTAISYAQKGNTPHVIQAILQGTIMTDHIVEDLSDLDLKSIGIELGGLML